MFSVLLMPFFKRFLNPLLLSQAYTNHLLKKKKCTGSKMIDYFDISRDFIIVIIEQSFYSLFLSASISRNIALLVQNSTVFFLKNCKCVLHCNVYGCCTCLLATLTTSSMCMFTLPICIYEGCSVFLLIDSLFWCSCLIDSVPRRYQKEFNKFFHGVLFHKDTSTKFLPFDICTN